MTSADFVVSSLGSIATILPLTADALDWIEENCAPEAWQWQPSGMVCEPRCLPAIIEAIEDDGFTIEH